MKVLILTFVLGMGWVESVLIKGLILKSKDTSLSAQEMSLHDT